MVRFDWTPWRILIVDHDDQFRFFARGLFQNHRVKDVMTASLAEDLPRIVAHHTINVAFVELQSDGSRVGPVLSWLRDPDRSPCPDLPVVLMARTLDRSLLARMCSFGIHGVLEKPVSGEKLLRAAVGVLTNPRMFKSEGEVPKPRRTSFSTSPRPADGPAPPSAAISPGPLRPTMPAVAGKVPATAGRRFVPPVGKPVPAVAIRRVADGEGSGPIPPATPVGAGAPDYSLLDDLPAGPAPSPGIELASAAAEPRETAISATVDDDTGLPGNRASPPLEVLPPTEPSGTDGLEVRTRRKREPGESTGDADIDAILALHAQWVESGGQQGRRAKLEGREIAGRNLAGAVLTSALLRRADISASDATDALMHGIDLRNADATGTRFVGADLAVARLRHARLCGCDLTGATLKGADLAGADLTGARFGHADLAGAILLGAHLAGADLSGVAGLTQAQLEGVDGDARTRLPPGLRLPVGPED